MNKGTENNATETNAGGNPHKKTKKINGLLIIVILILVTLVFSYRPDIPTVHCSDEILASKPDVIMFGTWWCPYCYQARRYLSNNNIRYCEYDIEKSAIGKQRYDDTKATAIPALIIGNYLLQGFNAEQIDEAIMLSKENNETVH